MNQMKKYGYRQAVRARPDAVTAELIRAVRKLEDATMCRNADWETFTMRVVGSVDFPGFLELECMILTDREES